MCNLEFGIPEQDAGLQILSPAPTAHHEGLEGDEGHEAVQYRNSLRALRAPSWLREKPFLSAVPNQSAIRNR